MSNEMATIDNMVSVDEIKAQVKAIQTLMQCVMRPTTKDNPNGHYGVVPGCGDKPTLLKAGAEKLAMAFSLDLQTEVEIVDMGLRHREYRCTTTVFSKNTGKRLGNGSGCASTLESKWRYRSENTGAIVPKEYWDSRNPELIGGSQFSTRKVDGQWLIFHKVDHDNPADYYNTCLKMAEKRSKVCAVLNVTAASDIFTQDIEEMQEVIGANKTTSGKPQGTKKTQNANKNKPASGNAEEVMTKIASVTESSSGTKKDGTPWTKYIIKSIGGTEYSTFEEDFKEVAEKAMERDVECLVLYKNDKYNSIEVIELTEAVVGV